MTQEFITKRVWVKSKEADAVCKRCGRSAVWVDEDAPDDCYVSREVYRKHKFGNWYLMRLYPLPKPEVKRQPRWNDG